MAWIDIQHIFNCRRIPADQLLIVMASITAEVNPCIPSITLSRLLFGIYSHSISMATFEVIRNMLVIKRIKVYLAQDFLPVFSKMSFRTALIS